MSSQDDDKDLFRKLYGDIHRVSHDRDAQLTEKRPSRPSVRLRRRSHDNQENPYQLSSDLDAARLSDIANDLTAAGGEYRGNGIQKSVMKKLKQGKITPEMILDLHGMSREQALAELQDFIQQCRQQQLRCVQIIHGKGYRSESGKAVLKPAVAHWLQRINDVLAYCPALPHDGGDGAVYVLLKTSRPTDAT